MHTTIYRPFRPTQKKSGFSEKNWANRPIANSKGEGRRCPPWIRHCVGHVRIFGRNVTVAWCLLAELGLALWLWLGLLHCTLRRHCTIPTYYRPYLTSYFPCHIHKRSSYALQCYTYYYYYYIILLYYTSSVSCCVLGLNTYVIYRVAQKSNPL